MGSSTPCAPWLSVRHYVAGFLTYNVAPNGKHFIRPLRINGSALESIYSILKLSIGGKLSSLSYGPSLGKLINRKDIIQNKNSEKGYGHVFLNISGTVAANVTCSTSNLVIPCQTAKLPLHFHFPNMQVHNWRYVWQQCMYPNF